MRHRGKIATLLAVLGIVAGCRTFSPTPMDDVGFKQRAVKRTEEGVTVSIVVLTADEAKAVKEEAKIEKKEGGR